MQFKNVYLYLYPVAILISTWESNNNWWHARSLSLCQLNESTDKPLGCSYKTRHVYKSLQLHTSIV